MGGGGTPRHVPETRVHQPGLPSSLQGAAPNASPVPIVLLGTNAASSWMYHNNADCARTWGSPRGEAVSGQQSTLRGRVVDLCPSAQAVRHPHFCRVLPGSVLQVKLPELQHVPSLSLHPNKQMCHRATPGSGLLGMAGLLFVSTTCVLFESRPCSWADSG